MLCAWPIPGQLVCLSPQSEGDLATLRSLRVIRALRLLRLLKVDEPLAITCRVNSIGAPGCPNFSFIYGSIVLLG